MFTHGLYYIIYTVWTLSAKLGCCPFLFDVDKKVFYITKNSRKLSFPFTCMVFVNNLFCVIRTVQAKSLDVSVIVFSWSYLATVCSSIPSIVCTITSIRTLEYLQVLNLSLSYIKSIESKKLFAHKYLKLLYHLCILVNWYKKPTKDAWSGHVLVTFLLIMMCGTWILIMGMIILMYWNGVLPVMWISLCENYDRMPNLLMLNYCGYGLAFIYCWFLIIPILGAVFSYFGKPISNSFTHGYYILRL